MNIEQVNALKEKIKTGWSPSTPEELSEVRDAIDFISKRARQQYEKRATTKGKKSKASPVKARDVQKVQNVLDNLLKGI